MISKKLRPYGTTIFSEMTEAALENEAVNLAQGYPDFSGPAAIVEHAHAAMLGGENQYARSMGHAKLVTALARRYEERYALVFDPWVEIMVASGATEAITAALLGLLEPGDEVLTFEPFYDSYPAAVALAHGELVTLPLQFPDFAIDFERLAELVTDRTRVFLLNSPHNPAGRVFRREELEALARICIERNLLVISDEVYEELCFDGARHTPIACIEGMGERTLTISSSGKTFSYTGWKIGWAAGPGPLVAAAAAAHQFLTFSTATPLQVAMAEAFNTLGEEYFSEYRQAYARRRQILSEALVAAGYPINTPQGAYFILADISGHTQEDGFAYAMRMIREKGVAPCPTSTFYRAAQEEGRKLIRFAFCKSEELLREASRRMQA